MSRLQRPSSTTPSCSFRSVLPKASSLERRNRCSMGSAPLPGANATAEEIMRSALRQCAVPLGRGVREQPAVYVRASSRLRRYQSADRAP